MAQGRSVPEPALSIDVGMLSCSALSMIGMLSLPISVPVLVLVLLLLLLTIIISMITIAATIGAMVVLGAGAVGADIGAMAPALSALT
jgi:hypothetical protein